MRRIWNENVNGGRGAEKQIVNTEEKKKKEGKRELKDVEEVKDERKES
jgi:hypothetical protein